MRLRWKGVPGKGDSVTEGPLNKNWSFTDTHPCCKHFKNIFTGRQKDELRDDDGGRTCEDELLEVFPMRLPL